MERTMRWMLLLALLAAPSGCAEPLLTGPDAELVGSWTWVRSEGGIYPQVRTPESEGIVRVVTFLATGTVRVEENGILVAQTSWETGVGEPGTYHEGRPVIRYGRAVIGFEVQAFSLALAGAPAAGTLVLDDGCCDAFVHTYAPEGS